MKVLSIEVFATPSGKRYRLLVQADNGKQYKVQNREETPMEAILAAYDEVKERVAKGQ